MTFAQMLTLAIFVLPFLVGILVIFRKMRQEDMPEEDIPESMVMKTGTGFEVIHMYDIQKAKTYCGYKYDEKSKSLCLGDITGYSITVTVDPEIVSCKNCRRILDKEAESGE